MKPTKLIDSGSLCRTNTGYDIIVGPLSPPIGEHRVGAGVDYVCAYITDGFVEIINDVHFGNPIGTAEYACCLFSFFGIIVENGTPTMDVSDHPCRDAIHRFADYLPDDINPSAAILGMGDRWRDIIQTPHSIFKHYNENGDAQYSFALDSHEYTLLLLQGKTFVGTLWGGHKR